MSDRTVVDAWLADLTFPYYMDTLFARARQFERAHPEYEIRIRGIYFEDMPGAVAQGVREGTVPAIAEYYYTETPNALDEVDNAGRPVFTSVSTAVGDRTEILGEPVVLDDILPALRAQYTCYGELRSLPTVATTYNLFTNVTMLEAAGVTEVPQTWQDLRAACERVVKSPGGPPHAIGWANHGIPFQHAMAVQGGKIADNGNGRTASAQKIDFTIPEMLAWVSWWRELYKDGLYQYSGETGDWFGTFQLFADQEIAFRMSSSNDVGSTAEAAKEAGFELAVTRFPYNADVPYRGNVVAGTSLWLADGLDRKTQDGALAFMQYLANPGHVAEYHKEHSFIPVTRSGFALLERQGWFDEQPYHRAPNNQLEVMTADGRPAGGALVGNYFRIQELLAEAMHDMLVRDVDPVERLTRASADAQVLLDQYLAERPRSPRR
ncbi:ABC transporter substrate-binding protein [Amycolatopsis cihanbeyliensis]|uniref:Carbohydrate ABC transporter substrate-binding protein (CUT1 family) n=1 Tax=Amycolatopsis cihanbeyliensis TaxID=1128664 RepID=A0A542DQA1_AMYCI|nr:extracellular solute-binding protein [Amycolatopsis cihanbeyliensis]TQJ05237.1 carbohydrate ABC transporter substrate-binding protein (CUT1 family) [Amycolatopsis cihanbeyliensis]